MGVPKKTALPGSGQERYRFKNQQRCTHRSTHRSNPFSSVNVRILQTVSLLALFTSITTHGMPNDETNDNQTSSLSRQQIVLSSRGMQQDDFAELNAILSDVVLEMPENPPPFSSGGITMDLYNIVCRDIKLGNAVLSSRRIDSLSMEVQVTLSQLDFTCNARYNYKGALGVGGRGDVSVATRGNQAVAIATVSSTSPTIPPTNALMNSCDPTIQIVNIDFSNGGIISWVLNIIERMLRTTMERLAQETICRELEAVLQGQTKDFLTFAKRMLNKYTNKNSLVTDENLIAQEREVEKSSNLQLLNLQQQETEFGRWINELLIQGVKHFNAPIPTPDGGNELQVNKLLRSFVLDENGALLLDQAEGGLAVFEVHDILTETSIVVDRVKLIGLDTLTRFDPFSVMSGGKYTLQTTLGWKYLGLEIDATFTIRPSTRPDSIIVETGNSAQPVVEKVSGYVAVRDLVANTSLLAAIDKSALENLRLGSLLSTDHVMNCLLSTIHSLEWTSMTVEAADVLTPSVSGLVSPGIDRVLTSAIDAAFIMYKPNMLNGAPSYFQQEIRPMLNQRLLNGVVLDRAHNDFWSCPPLLSRMRDGSIDFRDLLLPPEEARVLGGSGSGQYGDLISGVFMPYLRRQVLDPSNLNANVIRALTQQQSGREGVLEFNDIYDYRRLNNTVFEFLTFKVSKVSVSNLDSATDPIQFFNPTSENTLANQLSFGGGTIRNSGGSKALNVTTRLFLEIGGQESPLRMRNEVDFSFAIPFTSLSIGLLANFNERKFLDFPLDDITNPYCWLAAIERNNPASDKGLVQGGFGSAGVFGGGFNGHSPPTAKETHNLALSALSFTLSTFFMDSTCIQASSPACDSVSGVIRRLQQAGIVSSFRESIVTLVEESMMLIWNDFNSQELVTIAPRYCPHSDEYDPRKSFPDLKLPSLSGLSTNSSATLIALGFVVVEAAIVVAAKNQLFLVSQDPDRIGTPSASTLNASIPEGDDILDWENLSERRGAWVDVMFDELRGYISTPVDSKREFRSKRGPALSPRANVLLRNYVLDNTGEFVFDFHGPSAFSQAFSVLPAKVRINGLDSITAIDPLTVVDSHTLKTTASLEELTIVLDFDVLDLPDAAEHIHVIYAAKKVSLDVEIAVALNTTTLGTTQLGSVFDLEHIDSCLVKGIQALEVTKLNFSATEFYSPVINGYFSEQRRDEISLLIDTLHTEYQNEINEAIPLLLESTVRRVVNALIPSILQDTSSRCPVPPVFEDDGLIDFRELLLSETSSERLGGSGKSTYGNLFLLIYDVLDKEIMQNGANSRPLLSELIGTMTQQQSNISGTIRVPGMAVDSQTTMQVAGLKADLGFRVSDVLIQNLDSIGDPLQILRPVFGQPTILNNSLSFGVDSKPLIFAGTITLSLSDGAEMNIRNEVNVSLAFADVSLQIAFLVQILENSISNFPFKDFSDWRCWLSTILISSSDAEGFTGMRIVEQNYSLGNFSIDISCNSCTSPSFDDLLMSLYAPSDLSSAFQEQANSLMDAGFLRGTLETLIFDSKKRCPHHLNFDSDYVSQTQEYSARLSSPALQFSSSEETGKSMYFNIANGIIAACLCITGFCGKLIVARRNKKWMASLSEEGKFFFHRQQEKENERSKWLDDNTTSLVLSPDISRTVRLGVPLALLANIGLFMGGHLGVLSVVNLEAMLAGESFTIRRFMEFSFLESTRTTYHNGGAEMVILIWIFTGLWPYLKLLLSLGVWVSPTSYIGVKRRGTVLLWIDALAKLSVIDIFTVLLGVAVFLIFIGGPDDSINSKGAYYALKAVVVPKAGCYCLLIAQRMSRVSSRFLLEYHDIAVSRATTERLETKGEMSVSQIHLSPSSIPEVDEDIQGTGSSSFEACLEGDESILEGQRDEQSSEEDIHQESFAQSTKTASSNDSSFVILKDYRWGYWGAVFGFIAIVLIFAIGCIFAPAIAFDLSTITGLAMESEKTFQEAVSEYGVFVVVSGILIRAQFVLNNKVDYIGLGLLLSAVGIFFSLIFMIHVYQFVKQKLIERRKGRNNLQGTSYGHDGCGLPFYFRLYKWRHMEIFFISFVIGIWQLGSISSYSMYMYCDLLTRIYDILTFLGIAEASTTQCFKDQASNGGNLTIIILSFLILSASFVFEARAHYKENIKNCLKDIDERDRPRLSLAWSCDRSKTSRFSRLTESTGMSLSNMESFNELSTPPSSPGLSRASSTDSGRNNDMPGSDLTQDSRSQASHCDEEEDDISSPCVQNEDPCNYPVATPCSVASSSRHSNRSSVIDACCEAAPPSHVSHPLVESLEGNERPQDTPPLMPSWSMEEDPPEVSSFDSTPTPTVSSPLRLSYLLNHLPLGPRRSLPPSTTGNFRQEENNMALSRPRRVRSTEDILHYMEENPDIFT
ncbi:hypothetical protein IV203_026828 [Nitzschia inconspicua]|uniref:Uncharacterized protein n=1 Tax=Nitzschia inconspicua TaxID=303405 RepID=A0A9K3K5T6_9STRA|nr:hypothetical protein IV203_006822 [Nitzschia inconspicua]KAG7363467.1 hypothetical protein IV203_026828 [Nitzschia inconspicua]